MLNTVLLQTRPRIISAASVVGPKEKAGPLGTFFDDAHDDDMFGQVSFEKAERAMYSRAVSLCAEKAGFRADELDLLVGGDLLNQLITAGYAARGFDIPFLGIYGACSTIAESLALLALLTDAGYVSRSVCAASSHFSSAERQYRLPLEMGGQRPQSAQRTVTGAGAFLVASEGAGPFISAVTIGRVMDFGIKDSTDMGSAMAPAAADTILRFFRDTGDDPADYDSIITGDLGMIGREIAAELMTVKGLDVEKKLYDCGCGIFSPDQDTHAGGSGCGCSSVVMAAHILPKLRSGELKKVLFIATGALMSPTSGLQGESIPAVAHAVRIESERGQGR